MQNLLTLLVAMAIGYAFGWYQFAYSVDPATDSTAQQSATTQTTNTKVQNPQAKNTQKLLEQVDTRTVSNAIDTVSNFDTVNYTDLASLVLSPSVGKASAIIDGMSPSEIRLALTSITSFNSEQIQEMKDPSTFAKRLLTLALFKEIPEDADNPVTRIDFGTKVDVDNKIVDPKTHFESNTRKVYASFHLDQPADQVFIKWYQASPYKLHLFNKYSLNTSRDDNYIWYKPNTWSPGLYTVDVYAIDSQLTKLATGSFTIEE